MPSLIPSPDNITELAPNEIFVYGSNVAGRHGKGAAKVALQWGAMYGKAEFNGKTYGISTKDDYLRIRSLPIIERQVENFIFFAEQHPELTFLVTKIGCGEARYFPRDIALFFRTAPSNVRLPQSFLDVLK